jgi:glycosyltransferase involved in cell wall biosynthesis
MASGTAVVATETGGAREIIRAGETGLLVPVVDVMRLGDGIISLLGNKGLRNRMGSSAQDSVSAQFGVERMIEETEELYRMAIAEK